jgi:hypothetical protein
VSEKIELNHAVVGDEISLKGKANGADIIGPTSLPNCDVLELDCEGAEQTILEKITIRPRVILVETHAYLGSSPDKIRTLLHELLYEITKTEIATPDRIQLCLENGIKVITAIGQE